MARTIAPGRLQEIADAATHVFIAKGYRRTLMTDVAQRVPLSSGALYTYVESKEALFELALLSSLGPGSLGEPALPLSTPPPGRVVALVERWLDEHATFPLLAAATARRGRPPTAPIEAELAAIIDERYSLIESSRRLLALIERSAMDLPELADVYYHESRRGQVAKLAEYLEKRIRSGQVRPVPDTATAARFVIETIAWFAWHRKGDPDSAMIDDVVARDTVRHMLTSALLL